MGENQRNFQDHIICIWNIIIPFSLAGFHLVRPRRVPEEKDDNDRGDTVNKCLLTCALVGHTNLIKEYVVFIQI